MTVHGSYDPARRNYLDPRSSPQVQQRTDSPVEDHPRYPYNPSVTPDGRQVMPGTSNVYRTDWDGEL